MFKFIKWLFSFHKDEYSEGGYCESIDNINDNTIIKHMLDNDLVTVQLSNGELCFNPKYIKGFNTNKHDKLLTKLRYGIKGK